MRNLIIIFIFLSVYFETNTPTAKCQEPSTTVEDRNDATECLALAIAYEAGYETVKGQQAVAEVILNRLKYPSFPKTVCGVVFDGSTRRSGCQFTFTCDGSLYRRKIPPYILQSARSIATEALAGHAPSMVSGATHYHADYVHPYWAPSLTRIAQIGRHIFYHSPGAQVAKQPFPGNIPDGVRTFPPPAVPGSRGGQAGQFFAPWGLPLPQQ